jgi:hypothetical protein
MVKNKKQKAIVATERRGVQHGVFDNAVIAKFQAMALDDRLEFLTKLIMNSEDGEDVTAWVLLRDREKFHDTKLHQLMIDKEIHVIVEYGQWDDHHEWQINYEYTQEKRREDLLARKEQLEKEYEETMRRIEANPLKELPAPEPPPPEWDAANADPARSKQSSRARESLRQQIAELRGAVLSLPEESP